MSGIPRRPRSWLEDPPRRARIEAAARRAYPQLRVKRTQARTGPTFTYTNTLDVPGYDPRRVQVVFRHPFTFSPEIFADGPADPKSSPHRFADRAERGSASGIPAIRRNGAGVRTMACSCYSV